MTLYVLMLAATLSAQAAADRPVPEDDAVKPGQFSLRFKDEAPAAWAELVDRCSRLSWSGTFSTTSRIDPGPGIREAGRGTVSGLQYRQKGTDHYVVVETRVEDLIAGKFPSLTPGSSRVEGINPAEYFSLSRPNSNEAYTLRARKSMPIDRLPPAISNAQIQSAGMLCTGSLPMTRSLVEIHTNPVFEVRRVVDVRSGSRDLVRVEFVYAPWEDRPSLDVWVLLDPRNHWAVVESEISQVYEGKSFRHHARCEYDDGEGGFPIVNRITRTREVSDGSMKGGDVFEFDRWEYVEVPDAEFTLPAFGLPEGDW